MKFAGCEGYINCKKIKTGKIEGHKIYYYCCNLGHLEHSNYIFNRCKSISIDNPNNYHDYHNNYSDPKDNKCRANISNLQNFYFKIQINQYNHIKQNITPTFTQFHTSPIDTLFETDIIKPNLIHFDNVLKEPVKISLCFESTVDYDIKIFVVNDWYDSRENYEDKCNIC